MTNEMFFAVVVKPFPPFSLVQGKRMRITGRHISNIEKGVISPDSVLLAKGQHLSGGCGETC